MASQRKIPSAESAPRHRDAEVVRKAEAIFADMGMTPEEAIGIFYKQTALHGKFPITELIPNEETQAAIRKANAGVGIKRYASMDEFRAELDEIWAEANDERTDPDNKVSS
jgi:DNA-damage-inducible protein J